ncbi:uncharacterized protein BDZ99DRAFT_490216 [Mytilinidion resinicola]|uniref:Zn(2)-C6 fungal-type domain-containing protein n=1 Tax=Mytilinidion resinicola TaxID=574789 RepID=A0A6A6YC40_9PEZI|nr:uncharacterized protein BDZ99DRAFT_490216 [Mytilinidion resinicola]KAF2806381.1 hypothetical protein BDZ99DRAFT_490216 [Mytilinidion resinicola]
MSTVSANSASPPSKAAGQNHTRTYQACIPCRRRKVRCDMGPVDSPHDPPCVRCRRESKECFFSATRRKRKPQDSGEGFEDDGELSDYEIRNGRKRLKSLPSEGPSRPDALNTSRSTSYTSNQPQPPLTPGGSVARYEPLRRPGTNTQQTPPNPPNDEEDQKLNNATAAILSSKEVYSGHDALNLLFEAAGRNGDIEQHHRTGSSGSHARPMLGMANTPGSQNSYPSPQANTLPSLRGGIGGNMRNMAEAAVDPAIQMSTGDQIPTTDATYADAVRAWGRFRFVRAGWLTAKEAIAYIDYFYTYLSPLTPIVVPDYRDHSLHAKLLKDEPLLTVTLLTIASRFAPLVGPGASSRPYAIHEKLWAYLQGMVDRLIWGQEQFGGGFCGAGQQAGADVNPLSRKGLRTLGTVESLMLLTEWHPRALHYPPGDDDDELLVPEPSDGSNISLDLFKGGPGGQRIDSWLEPCWRSDRMCWMLLGNAVALAVEIGVFDEKSEAEFREDNESLPHQIVKAYYRRRNHLKDLLNIYLSQTSGRLGLTSMVGLTSMLPKVQRDLQPSDKRASDKFTERMADIKRQTQWMAIGNPGQRGPFETVQTQARHAIQDLVLNFWDEIAKIMELGNLELFASRKSTRTVIASGEYQQKLQSFQDPLKTWKADFDRSKDLPTQLRHILMIEYDYTRVYINSLALQAVLERVKQDTAPPDQLHPGSFASKQPNSSSSSNAGLGANPHSMGTKWYGNDRYYVSEVSDGCRSLLRTVVEGLYPGDYLKHAPVRTFFRIISVAIILLKTFALGAPEDDVALSLGLLSRAIEALRSSIVDDVHVGNRFADLLDTLTRRTRARFVRMTTTGGSTGISRAGSHEPPGTTGIQTPMMPPPTGPLGAGGAQWGAGASGSGFGLSNPTSPSLSNRNTNTPILHGQNQNQNHAQNPLWGISTEPYDPSNNNISIMPPPYTFPYNAQGGHSNHTAANSNEHLNFGNGTGHGLGGGGDVNGGGQQDGYFPDWLALPLDPLLNTAWGQDVNQTTFGPDVGGTDLLDLLLSMGGGGG